MYFQLLQGRLIEALRNRMENGLLTERGLARSTGVSQPHMHHIMKGARTLSPQIADRILRVLKLTVVDLLDGTELEERSGEAAGPGWCAEQSPSGRGRSGTSPPPDAARWPAEAPLGAPASTQALLDHARHLREQAHLLLAQDGAVLSRASAGPRPPPDRSPASDAPLPPS